MTVERRRDNQQWLLDYLVKTTGRVQNFGNDERQLPAEVKSYAMIPRVLQKHAQQQEQIAERAAAAGHTESARALYWRATQTYIEAQHAIFEDDDPEKIYLHGKVLECYDRLIETSDYPIERVEIPWGEHRLQGLLHLLPDRRRAPTILLVPGMDMTKESLPSPPDEAAKEAEPKEAVPEEPYSRKSRVPRRQIGGGRGGPRPGAIGLAARRRRRDCREPRPPAPGEPAR